ncbi:MAG: glycosyl hydrolase family 62, partial [Streptomyces sp.]|nr:glycosyl hydrolase family 62 [Streptomyces sp.]
MATPPVRTFFSGPVLTLLAPELAAPAPGPAAAGDRTGPPPDSFGWSSIGPLIATKPDAGRQMVSVKDLTVFRYNFADWSQAADAHLAFLDADPNSGNR